jgi:hypothetical protein
MRKPLFLCLLTAVLLVTACSESNLDSPGDSGIHPQEWIAEHSEEVEGDPEYAACTECHGEDLAGSGGAIGCYSCHAFNTTPPFIIHPASWSDPYTDHRAFAASNGFDDCLGCHGAGLNGTPAAPSCFSASFDGQGCHEEGPGEVPHPLDGSYLAGNLHGPDAKQDLTACQPCHGEAGGPGDNPRFNVGITGTGCEVCHGEDLAHPEDWAGPNDTFHYSAGNIQEACTLCHGVDLDGVGGVGPSCLGCHDSATAFTLDCTFCHGYPPEAPEAIVDHSGIPLGSGNHDECNICHGMSESEAGGGFDPNPNYILFDKATDTIGDHWDNNIQIGAFTQYDEDNHVCGTCHNNDPGHAMSDSGLTVIQKDMF